MRHALLSLSFLLLAAAAHGAQTRYTIVHYTSGTGFFVDRDGHIVTNAHVVEKCKSAAVSGAVSAPAEVIARDEENDLALLKTAATPPDIAEIRSEYFPIEKNERVVTVGFPGVSGLTTREATVIEPKGPTGEKQWLQFTSSVTQGNSGGPLLDEGGKVIGVVMAKAELYRENPDAGRNDLISTMDVAIQPSVLRAFLADHHVRYRESASGGSLAAHRVEDRAREFVVNVRCLQ